MSLKINEHTPNPSRKRNMATRGKISPVYLIRSLWQKQCTNFPLMTFIDIIITFTF